MVNTQAQIIAYMDDYKFLLFTTIPAMACLLLMRRPEINRPPALDHGAFD